jgi:hypothetical protein
VFFDFTLQRRVYQASQLWYMQAQERLETHPAYQEARTIVGNARDALEEAARLYHAAQDSAQVVFERDVELPPVIVPEVELSREASAPLFHSLESFSTASERLIAHKALQDS